MAFNVVAVFSTAAAFGLFGFAFAFVGASSVASSARFSLLVTSELTSELASELAPSDDALGRLALTLFGSGAAALLASGACSAFRGEKKALMVACLTPFFVYIQ